MNLEGLHKDAKRLSSLHCIPAADLLYILSHITGLNTSQMILEKDRVMSSEEIILWKQLSQRRINGEPSQYITGLAWFYGRGFTVNPKCLIPRPETEGLVELVIQSIGEANLCILDIGTGSGAISISLALEIGKAEIHALDISQEALELAKENAAKLGAKVTFHHADLFPPGSQQFDVIVSNPPYISVSDYQDLPPHIRMHEPKRALVAGRDGLDCYKRILTGARSYLKQDGFLALEIGASQASQIKSIAKNLHYSTVETYRDLNDCDRYLIIRN